MFKYQPVGRVEDFVSMRTLALGWSYISPSVKKNA